MCAQLVGRYAWIVELVKLLVDVACLVVIRHSSPALQHAEIGHCAQESGFAGDALDCLLTDLHGGYVAYYSVGTVDKFVEVLPVVLYAAAVGCERVAARHIGPWRCAVGYVAAHVEGKLHAEAPRLFHS